MPRASLLPALLLASIVAAPCAARADRLEADVLAELNYARAQPQRYAEELAQALDTGRSAFRTLPDEDPQVVEEAIDFLMGQAPLPELRTHQGLTAAAAAHVRSQARRGEGHGPVALSARLQRQGVFAGLSGENISYGYRTPRDVVLQLIIDSRVPGRGHRKTIFGRSWQAAGVACGPHPAYGAMCVIDFAGAIVER
ncbi:MULTISPECIES: CAP domain-containing protein [Phenylobacterium]|uniref:Uncharacterized protein YkwD n=1 Tax=Phenylobacterium koreense TaxID=266125 RepID=A0ABV2EEE3_9CAUL